LRALRGIEDVMDFGERAANAGASPRRCVRKRLELGLELGAIDVATFQLAGQRDEQVLVRVDHLSLTFHHASAHALQRGGLFGPELDLTESLIDELEEPGPLRRSVRALRARSLRARSLRVRALGPQSLRARGPEGAEWIVAPSLELVRLVRS